MLKSFAPLNFSRRCSHVVHKGKLPVRRQGRCAYSPSCATVVEAGPTSEALLELVGIQSHCVLDARRPLQIQCVRLGRPIATHSGRVLVSLLAVVGSLQESRQSCMCLDLMNAAFHDQRLCKTSFMISYSSELMDIKCLYSLKHSINPQVLLQSFVTLVSTF